MNKMGHFGQISEINDHLYLSGAGGLKHDKLRQKKINCIVNATVEEPNVYLDGVDYLKIRVEDHPFAHLDNYFDLVADKIKATRERGGHTLVHCVAGVSRSASLCMIYLVKHEKMSLRQAYYHVKSVRPIVRPNPGFWKQMIDYELRLKGKNTVRLIPTRIEGEAISIPDVYTEELRMAMQTENGRRASASSLVRRPPLIIPNRLTSSRRSISPPASAVSGYLTRKANGYDIMSKSLGPATQSARVNGVPKAKGNIFSTLYDRQREVLFPTF